MEAPVRYIKSVEVKNKTNWRRSCGSGVYIFNFEHIPHLSLIFPLILRPSNLGRTNADNGLEKSIGSETKSSS